MTSVKDLRKLRDFTTRVPEEWPYFIEWARNFPGYPKNKQFGILIMGAQPLEENMIYAPSPALLRIKHIEHLMAHPDLLKGTVSGFVNFLQWLEKLEGKESHGPSSPELKFK